MKKLTKKILAVILAAVMLLLPTAVFAEVGVTYEMGAALEVGTAEYEACALDYTVYTFKPAEVGIYTIISANLMGIVSNNGMWVNVEPTASTIAEKSIEWKCNSVGQSIWVAVETKGEAVTISVEQAPIEIVTIPVEAYTNIWVPEPFVFEGDAEALLNVNVTDEYVDIPVEGFDGVYRLNSADGPRILVDLNDEQMNLCAAMETGPLRVGIFDGEGKIDHYVDYAPAFTEYKNCMDAATGLYPLTDDLMEIYKEVGEYKTWYGEDGWFHNDAEDAWMFACYYLEDDIYTEGGDGDVTYDMGAALTVGTAEYEACSYKYTVYTFDPTEEGRYTISSDKLLGIASYTGMWVTEEPSPITVYENSITWDCESVGQAIWVAVETDGEPVTITVEWASIEVVEIPTVNYENVTNPEAFTFDGAFADLIHVNVSDETVDVAVLDADGVYRLNSVNGPRIFVDLNYAKLNLCSALEYGQLVIGVLDGEGNIEYYLDYAPAFTEYMNCMDTNGLYPLTDDLIEIYTVLGANKGWYEEDGFVGATGEDAWMFACYYLENDGIEEPEEWPVTDPAKLAELSEATYTANKTMKAPLVANEEYRSVFTFTTWKAGLYTVSAARTGTKEFWIVDAEGNIVANGSASKVALEVDLEAGKGETYYVLTSASHTSKTNLTLNLNYFTGKTGDVSGDGRVNARDTAMFKMYMVGTATDEMVCLKALDMNGDGRITAMDGALLKMEVA